MAGASGQFRVWAANLSAAAALLAAARYTVTTLNALLTGASDAIIALGPSVGHQNATRRRGLEISFCGTGANNTTLNYRIWRVKRGRSSTGALQPNDMELHYLGGGLTTLSAMLGATGATTVLPTERIADTLTWVQGTALTTPKGIGDTAQSAYAAASAVPFSPADDTPAMLFIPDVGLGDVIIEIWKGTATDGNAVAEVVG